MSEILRRPGFDCTCASTEYCAEKSIKNCWVCRVCSHAWNSRAALGCGAAAKIPVGPEIVGVPSVGYTGSTGWPASFSSTTPYSLPSAITARSPSESFFGGSVDDCTCMTRCFASFSKYSQPSSHHLEGCGHDRTAIGGMALDHLAGPFRVEQVGETLGRVLGVYKIGVVGDR